MNEPMEPKKEEVTQDIKITDLLQHGPDIEDQDETKKTSRSNRQRTFKKTTGLCSVAVILSLFLMFLVCGLICAYSDNWATCLGLLRVRRVSPLIHMADDALISLQIKAEKSPSLH
ncbi:hypothetical protein F2P81_017659 [Scophthalmus maximus]|uniref:Uncharacterized protein n=1 Tax=Scophthalmus maximus TaxID=52904 RepID=A0A6A4SFC7_SCOMX|nr:hypothetical protein F2P81_017659 [Scophthalmus maximus]